MSFVKNETQQLRVDDRLNNSSPRTINHVLNSWAKDFAEIVFPAINESRFSVLYAENPSSRPNTPVNIVIGALLLKELQGLSDDEIIESLICGDLRYQYALHTTSYEEQPLSDRTFSRFRERLYKYEELTGRDLLKEEICALAEHLREYMKITPSVKRQDSLMIASNCKRMTRLETC
jgi:hypothetical protein